MTILSLIRKEIRGGFLGLMIFFLALFVGFEAFSFWRNVKEVKQLVVGQVESLVSNKALSQDYLAIQPELSRFVASLKNALPYDVEISVRIGGSLIAGAGDEKSIIPSTTVISETLLPSGQKIEVLAEIFHGRAIASALGILFLICASCVVANIYLNRRLEKSVENITDPLLKTIDWVEELSSNLPASLKTRPIGNEKNIAELGSLNSAVGRFVGEIETLGEKLAKASRDLAKIELAEQVGHDIRSPLTTIDTMIRSFDALSPTQKTEIEKPILRIMDVLNDLRPRNEVRSVEAKCSEDRLRPEFLFPLTQDIVREKKALYQNTNIRFNCVAGAISARASLNRQEYVRALSNLIDNAAHALPEIGGVIEVSLAAINSNIEIKISDSGKGIPSEYLPKIGGRGVTFGKESGSGLGVYQAKKMVEALSGHFSIDSTVGIGTTVTLSIPGELLKGIAEGLSLPEGEPLIVIDDDPLIREAWENRGLPFLKTYSSPEAFLASDAHTVLERARFIVDLEFANSSMDGIDLINRLEIQDRATLITGKWDTPSVALRCECFEILRFPKELVAHLKIVQQHGSRR